VITSVLCRKTGNTISTTVTVARHHRRDLSNLAKMLLLTAPSSEHAEENAASDSKVRMKLEKVWSPDVLHDTLLAGRIIAAYKTLDAPLGKSPGVPEYFAMPCAYPDERPPLPSILTQRATNDVRV